MILSTLHLCKLPHNSMARNYFLHFLHKEPELAEKQYFDKFLYPVIGGAGIWTPAVFPRAH